MFLIDVLPALSDSCGNGSSCDPPRTRGTSVRQLDRVSEQRFPFKPRWKTVPLSGVLPSVGVALRKFAEETFKLSVADGRRRMEERR